MKLEEFENLTEDLSKTFAKCVNMLDEEIEENKEELNTFNHLQYI